MNTYQEIIKRLDRGAIYLFTLVSGERLGEKAIWQDGKLCGMNPELEEFWRDAVTLVDLTLCPYRYDASGQTVFVERLIEEPELVICGGGHISLELALLAGYLEYPYTVIDDREEFANRERFPGAKECICRDFKEVLSEREFSSNTYYIIVTRGHAADLECLELVLRRPYGYVGMIGSRAKVKKVMDTLRDRGVSEEKLSQVHAPIGLPIGGQTPKEIGVSIIAQLILVKNEDQPSSYLERRLKEAIRTGGKKMLLRIIGKRGSAPRGVGSRMIVYPDGSLCGTIGGGVVEYKAVENAVKLLQEGCERAVETYRLDTGSAASLGMWCGGEVDVLFETC